MDIIKIRYTFRHKGSGNIEMKWYNIGQLEERAAAKLSPVFSDEYELISRDLYTGLKDNTDREIYEGDIIHCVHWFFDGNEIEEHFTASVGFRDGSFTLENINSRYYSDYTFEENGKGICWIGDINYCDEDYEIIGNIYQNPDLLLEVTE
ncbi:YopX family protein [Bacillus licheniformis]|uniref:YopX family protein n=1 Tax=Bacillus licheniformis TaxID=1402 RepID=UPI00237CEB5A|nr:YopX family protein [Bacillus licheniformis]MDE1367495.1 YopX family protein [Bacillus licheniformis]